MLTHGIPPDFRGGVHLFIYTAIRQRASPRFIGSGNCVPMALLPRVRRHRVNSPQVSSSNGCCLCITMDQLMCVCVFSSHSLWTSSSLDVPAGVTQEEGHTGFLIHFLSAVRALIFLARRIQPFLSLVDREVEFCVLTI